MLLNLLYVSTKEIKGGKPHTFLLGVSESVPDGHEITNVRKARTWKFSDLISDQSAMNLFMAVKR